METGRYRDIVSVGWDIYHLLKAESERMSSVEVRKKLAEYMTLCTLPYSKALLLKNDESFVGEIRLQMAGCLIEKGMLQEALTELELYRTHREAKGWKTDTSYFRMKEKIDSDVTCPKKDGNLSLYRRYSHYADDFAYSNIEKLSYCVVRLFTNNNGTPLCILTDGHSTILTKVPRLKKCGKVDVGSIFHIRKSGDTIFSVERAECAPWQILPSAIFTVTNVNPVKCLFHLHGLPGDANVLFRDTPLRPSLGDRISANYYFSDKDGTKKMMIAHVTPAN